jgi:hypothetical protein
VKKIEEYTPCELVTLATAVGVIIASKLNVNQQNVVGNFLTGVAQSILIIAAQAQNLQTEEENQCGDSGNDNLSCSNSKKSNSKNSNKDLQSQIDDLKEYIQNIEDYMCH